MYKKENYNFDTLGGVLQDYNLKKFDNIEVLKWNSEGFHKFIVDDFPHWDFYEYLGSTSNEAQAIKIDFEKGWIFTEGEKRVSLFAPWNKYKLYTFNQEEYYTWDTFTCSDIELEAEPLNTLLIIVEPSQVHTDEGDRQKCQE